jgi:hypothetical protein
MPGRLFGVARGRDDGKTFGGTQWYLALQAGEVVTAPPIARAASGSAFPCARTGPCVLCS